MKSCSSIFWLFVLLVLAFTNPIWIVVFVIVLAVVLILNLSEDNKTEVPHDVVTNAKGSAQENFSNTPDKIYLRNHIADNGEREKYTRWSDRQVAKWVNLNEHLVLAGVETTCGGFYVGQAFKLPDNVQPADYYSLHKVSYIVGPAIDPTLPICATGHNRGGRFTSYQDMSPTWRYDLIMWMAGKVQLSELPKELFLFYLYGLEYRMFADPETSQEERRELLKEVVEYKQKLSQEDPAKSWELSHAFKYFIDKSLLTYFYSDDLDFVSNDIVLNCTELLDAKIQNIIKDSVYVDADMAYEIGCMCGYMEHLPYSISTEEWKKIFINKYSTLQTSIKVERSSFVGNNVIDIPINYSYTPLFCAQQIRISHPSKLNGTYCWAIKNAIQNVIYNIEKDFKSYNNLTDSGRRETILGVLNLPNYVDISTHPMFAKAQQSISNVLGSANLGILDTNDLLQLLQYVRQDEKTLHIDSIQQIIVALSRLKLSIVPLLGFDKKRLNFDSHCIIYKSSESMPTTSKEQNDKLNALAKLIAIVVHTDSLQTNDVNKITTFLSDHNISSRVITHILYSVSWLSLKKQSLDKTSKNIIGEWSEEYKNEVTSLLISLSYINGIVSSDRINACKAILSALGKDGDSIHSAIHRMITDDDEFATIEIKKGATKYKIPNLSDVEHSPSRNIATIDPHRLSALKTETQTAQELLTSIFVDDSENEVSHITNTHEVWRNILYVLTQKAEWSRTDVDKMCNEQGELLGSILEQINDYSYEAIGDAIVEDNGDVIFVNTDYVNELFNELT